MDFTRNPWQLYFFILAGSSVSKTPFYHFGAGLGLGGKISLRSYRDGNDLRHCRIGFGWRRNRIKQYGSTHLHSARLCCCIHVAHAFALDSCGVPSENQHVGEHLAFRSGRRPPNLPLTVLLDEW